MIHLFQVTISAVSSFLELPRRKAEHARCLERETRINVKKVMFFRTIRCLRRQVVLFLLLFKGMLEKESNAEGVAVPEGVKGCHERFLISKKAGKLLPS